MVYKYGIQKGGRGGVVYCAIIVQSYCTRVGNAGGRGEWKDGRFVHSSLEVNEYIVKAKPLHDISITNIVGCMAYKRGV